MSSRPSRGAARLAAILDALPDGLVLVNCNGTVVNANTIALGLFESPGTALVGRGLLDLLPEFDSRLIPGSMRRPDAADDRGRTKPARMIARRTDGSEFPVEVTSASLEDGREAYDSHSSYTGDELLMLVVRDLTGTVDTEAELARSQRQTEMILRAASEGVVGTDTDGRVVLVNPAAAQILGFRAGDLGGKELHPLILHSRPDGEPFPYAESPLADTLRSGRKHRVRGQVLWAKDGSKVPVDLTTAPVRDGDQLVGAVMTFTDRRPYEQMEEERAAELTAREERHAAELSERDERHAAELAEREERAAGELAERQERLDELEQRHTELAARHEQLAALLDRSLRGPLDELRAELSGLAADDAGQLWPEANQLLHHLAAGYGRMTTLVDNVLGYQRLAGGSDALAKAPVMLDGVVTAGIDGAVELIGPGRAQFAVHAPPIEAEVDAPRLITALAHLVADVAGVDATGKSTVTPAPGGGYVDSTLVVAAAQRGDVVRIEVRGPSAGGDAVHQPVVRGIVAAHGGVLQTHELPGMSGSAYVLEVPIGAGRGTVTPEPAPASVEEPVAAPALPAQQNGETTGGGRRRARRSSTDAFLESPMAPEDGPAAEPSGRRRGRTEEAPAAAELIPAQNAGAVEPTGRRRGRPAEGAVVTAAEGAQGRPALGAAVPPQGVPADAAAVPATRSGRRARRAAPEAMPALPPAGPSNEPGPAALPAASGMNTGNAASGPESADATPAAGMPVPATPAPDMPVPATPATGMPVPATPATGMPVAAAPGMPGGPAVVTPATGVPSRGVRLTPAGPQGGPEAMALPAPAAPSAPTGPVPPGIQAAPTPVAPVAPGTTSQGGPATPAAGVPNPPAAGMPPGLVPMGADGAPAPAGANGVPEGAAMTPVGLVPAAAQAPAAPEAGPAPVDTTPPHGTDPARPGGRRRRALGGAAAAEGEEPRAPFALPPADADRQQDAGDEGRHDAARDEPDEDHTPPQPHPLPTGRRRAAAAQESGTGSVPLPPALPMPAQAPTPTPASRAAQPLPAEAPTGETTQGRAFSVRTLGQGVPFAQQIATQQNGSGRRRKLATPPADDRPLPLPAAEPPAPAAKAKAQPQPQTPAAPQPVPPPKPAAPGEGRSYAIGAPDQDADEGPEPLDGPGGAVEIANQPAPLPVDDELPPEPLDNPRRLLVWPAPDVATQQALSDRGYRPVIVHSREEVDAQIAAFPAALFVDPLTGPITRTALQSLRQAAVAAEVPVLLAAGLGQATREAAYGADPAVLLKALAPRDSEQHPSRVLLIEEQDDIANALTATLERRGMQVARAAADTDAVALATQTRPNLVVMDLMQVRRRRAGIIDWLRANGQLNRTPLVVYTSAGLDEEELPKLSSGETVLFLAERSTSDEVQARIVDLLAKIGTN
ncbi:PAS domain-containing protein [Streptomyces sp. HUAS MG47]|uniref:response regulator n=1 Tax=Streptomyces solicamelliae TaxID=3231716 RepID=UPI0038781FB0